MNPQLEIIRDYIKGVKSRDELAARRLPFITISRSPGAGGHLAAHVICTEFLKRPEKELFDAWHVFDREIAELLADDPELRIPIKELQRDDYHSEFEQLLESLFTGQSRQYTRYRKTFQIVRLLAMVGKAVIVGGFGAFVTQDLPNGIHFRLDAPLMIREKRVIKKFGLSREEAHNTVVKQDHDRRKLANSFFSKKIDDPLHYDVVCNTERVHPYEIAGIAADMLLFRRSKRPD
ncbi:MAG: cytidylate kinase-like family protein [Verrucomicrobiota bacterium]|nr:cytidylate kinase-like family protein [Verrucomicrobiota bacterium]